MPANLGSYPYCLGSLSANDSVEGDRWKVLSLFSSFIHSHLARFLLLCVRPSTVYQKQMFVVMPKREPFVRLRTSLLLFSLVFEHHYVVDDFKVEAVTVGPTP